METKYVYVCEGMFGGESCDGCPRYGCEECSIKNSPSVKIEDIKNRRFNLIDRVRTGSTYTKENEKWEDWYNAVYQTEG